MLVHIDVISTLPVSPAWVFLIIWIKAAVHSCPPLEAVSVNSKTGAPALHLDRVLRGPKVNNDDRFDLDLT